MITQALFSFARVAIACDTAAKLAVDALQTHFHGGNDLLQLENEIGAGSPLTLLPQDKGDESPACLDGSPYGFYFRPSPTKSTKWTISIEGGGWCYDEAACFSRSKMALGSSKAWAKTAGCGCMNAGETGIDGTCNCLYMPYGDGASFSGFRPKPWPVPGQNATLTFRGIKNFDASIEWALQHGLKDATEFVLTGGSAGGLSTFLHLDRVADILARESPGCTVVRGAPVVGYFLDHPNFAHSDQSYTARMEYIYHMQNLTFGPDGGLMPACPNALKDAHKNFWCFMSPHMQQFIKTPFFMFNSKFDAWQIGSELQIRNWVGNKTLQDAIVQYGKDFMNQFAPVQSNPKHGAMITSCICHGCNWNSLNTGASGDNRTAINHYADWYNGKTTGTNSIHIDTRGPNGDGAITDSHCQKFS